MSTKRPVLLLDVMDTLVHEPYFTVMPAFFGLSLAQLQEQKHPTAWIEFELGLRSEAEFLRDFFRDGRDFDREGLCAAVRASYRWLPGMEALLGELALAGYAMHALSNYPEWFLWIEERLGLARYLSWSFVSCRTGVRKPDGRAFLEAARTLALPMQACLLVDDRAENCAAARSLGMAAVQFRSAPELRAELVQRGLLGGAA